MVSIRYSLDYLTIPPFICKDPKSFLQKCGNSPAKFMYDLYEELFDALPQDMYSASDRAFSQQDFSCQEYSFPDGSSVLYLGLPVDKDAIPYACAAYILYADRTRQVIRIYSIDKFPFGVSLIGEFDAEGTHNSTEESATNEQEAVRIIYTLATGKNAQPVLASTPSEQHNKTNSTSDPIHKDFTDKTKSKSPRRKGGVLLVIGWILVILQILGLSGIAAEINIQTGGRLNIVDAFILYLTHGGFFVVLGYFLPGILGILFIVLGNRRRNA